MAFPVGTPGGLSSADASTLMANLRKSAPPINPSTAPIRRDVTQDRYRALKQIQVSCDKCLLTVNDDEMPLKTLISTIGDTCNKLLSGIDPQQVIESLGQLFAPPPAPPMMGGMPGAPPMPSPGGPPMPPPGAPPMGAPPMPSPSPMPGM